VYSGSVPEHTEAAVNVLTGLSMDGAVTLADDTAVRTGDSGPVPDYELWRRAVQAHFAESTDPAPARS
jgi:hypothetical protein